MNLWLFTELPIPPLVLSCAVVLAIWHLFKYKTLSRYQCICTGLLWGGILCWVMFGVIGSTVDKEGILREPFALIPIGLLLMLGGVLGLFFRAAKKILAAWKRN